MRELCVVGGTASDKKCFFRDKDNILRCSVSDFSGLVCGMMNAMS